MAVLAPEIAPEVAIEEFAGFCLELVLENKRPMQLEPFQRLMLADYFGGTRESLVLIPKKNGKTALLAALGLFHLLSVDDADICIVAASRDQAMRLFEAARGFIQRSPSVKDRLRVLRGYREIRRPDPEDPRNPKAFRGIMKVYAADADTFDGWLGTLGLIDELHRHQSSDTYGLVRDGLGPRDGQMITISTAGDDEDSPLGELRAMAYELGDVEREGAHRHVRATGFALHEWALDAGQDLEDLELVKLANPASWQTPEALRERFDSPSMTKWQWARFACGVWGIGSEPAFDSDLWDALAKRGVGIDPGRLITLGFDGSRRRDATVLVATDVELGHQIVVGAWERPPTAGDEWEVPESEVDQAVEEAFSTWDVWRLYGDPPYWEMSLDRWAAQYGKERIVAWWTNRIKAMAFALRAFQTDMRPDAMSHDGDPLLSRHIANAVRQRTRMRDGDEELWVIRKDSSKSVRKIDGAMAACLSWEARGDAIAAGALKRRSGRTVGFR